MKAYQAYGPAGRVTAPTPQMAALEYFAKFPTARKCNVIEGKTDGAFFTIRYGRASTGEWPQSWHDVTKKTAAHLPHGMDEGAA